MAITDNIRNEDCLDIKELSDEMGVKVQRMRQILALVRKTKAFPYLTKKDGSRDLYPPQFVESLRKFREKGGAGKIRNKGGKSFKTSLLLIEVPVFDKEIADLLKHRFKSADEMRIYLQAKLEDTVKPKLSKLRQLENEFEKEKQKLMRADLD